MYDLQFHEYAIKMLAALPKKIYGQVIKKAEVLRDNPSAGYLLKGSKAIHRLRSGGYRILYLIKSNHVVIIDVGDRKEIYRRLERLKAVHGRVE